MSARVKVTITGYLDDVEGDEELKEYENHLFEDELVGGHLQELDVDFEDVKERDA